MVDVWAVIGDSHSRKTSTIRALTGVRQIEKSWIVEYAPGGPIATYVHPPGLQEIAFSPKNFIQAVTKSKAQRVIVALRYAAARRQPDAQTYLNSFSIAGWNIAGYAILSGQPKFASHKGAVVIAPTTPLAPCNAIARQLRAVWPIA